ncbi:MAG: threonine synthase [Microbacteriaceae bacterium]|nr:threonine synthase [Microbacteriaceae bacterium]
MEFISTRGGMEPISFSEVLLAGLAPDGGLAVPASLPHLSAADLEGLRELGYADLAAKIIGIFWPEIAAEDLLKITRAAYGSQFASDDIVPVTQLKNLGENGLGLAGLSEGPTLAFKDLAMQFLGEAIPYLLQQTGGKLNILGATSGDTGSAAEYAFRSKPNTSVIMLSPKGRMSDFQRAQMYSLADSNIHNVVVDGVFDDCQNLVKALNGDLDFKAEVSLGAVNSINFGRIAAQSVYYFWTWLRATDALAERERADFKVSFAVPSGNFGNVFSGFIARQLGLPVAALLVATNENDVLHEFFSTGVYRPRSAADTHVTSSPSMDISKASNIERFIFELLGRDGESLKTAFDALEATGALDLSEHLPRLQAEFGLFSGRSSHADRVRTIRETYEKTGVLIDPHTADGVHVALEFAASATAGDAPIYVLETAKPHKFAETVVEALDFEPELSAEMQEMIALPQRTVEIAPDPATLRDLVRDRAV